MKLKKYPYIIAEIGSNHNGDLDLAKKMIYSAKEVGCDCVKFQSFDERLFSKQVYEKSKFLDDGRDVSSDLLSTVRKYSLNPSEIKELCNYAKSLNIDFSSSVFEIDHIDVLIDAKVDFIKIASMDVDNHSLLKEISKSKLPIVMSTGMASLHEISEAVEIILNEGNVDLSLLHCVSLYPPNDKDINLKNIKMLKDIFGLPVGFSDHTKGFEIALASFASGAQILEKHFTLDKTMEGWDHAMSVEPQEMKIIVDGASKVLNSIGQYSRKLTNEEFEKRDVMRRSIVASRFLPKGNIISENDISFKRPGNGLSPKLVNFIVGSKTVRDINDGELIYLRDIGKKEL